MCDPLQTIPPHARLPLQGGGYLELRHVASPAATATDCSTPPPGAAASICATSESSVDVSVAEGDELLEDSAALPVSSGQARVLYFTYWVVHSAAYGVPVLYFEARNCGEHGEVGGGGRGGQREASCS